jgi:hypothetical protein
MLAAGGCVRLLRQPIRVLGARTRPTAECTIRALAWHSGGRASVKIGMVLYLRRMYRGPLGYNTFTTVHQEKTDSHFLSSRTQKVRTQKEVTPAYRKPYHHHYFLGALTSPLHWKSLERLEEGPAMPSHYKKGQPHAHLRQKHLRSN